MKNNTLIFSFLLTSFVAFSQEKYNPFEGIGKSTEVVTLSNGKYKEIYGGDTLKRIGNVIFDTKNNKVVQFLAEDDTITMVVKKEGDYATRWLSLDPLAAKYPSMSPYNFVGNSPLIFIDPDGRDFEIAIIVETDPITKETSRTIEIRTTIYINSAPEQGVQSIKEYMKDPNTSPIIDINRAINEGNFSYTDSDGNVYAITSNIQYKEVSSPQTKLSDNNNNAILLTKLSTNSFQIKGSNGNNRNIAIFSGDMTLVNGGLQAAIIQFLTTPDKENADDQDECSCPHIFNTGNEVTGSLDRIRPDDSNSGNLQNVAENQFMAVVGITFISNMLESAGFSISNQNPDKGDPDASNKPNVKLTGNTQKLNKNGTVTQ